VSGYEQLGLFYLGKRYDIDTQTRTSEPILYDSKDLVTHAMCVGMTGSGKTGLGITLIEEAAIDGVPVLAIDPKGDLANLLLTFPRLDSSEFLPWIDPAEAATRKLSAEDYAAAEAERWRAGLAEWDQTPERVAMLRAAAQVRLYTPGSRAATPLAILNGIGATSEDDDPDVRAAELSSTAASLLALVGYDAAEQHSREQALIAAILGQAGTAPGPGGSSRGADLGWLVQQVQRPSFDRVGVLDLETFYPARERQELALRFNSVLASPGFDVWLSGDPLDPASLLFTPEGKTPRRDRVDRASRRHEADARCLIAAERSPAVDAPAARDGIAARPGLHGRSVRVPAAGGQSTIEAAVVDAAQAGPGIRRRHHARDAESGRSRLQGAVEHRHLVPRQAADGTRQGTRARWSRGSRRRDGARHARSNIVGAAEPRLSDAQRERAGASAVRNAMDAVLSARASGT
jgi:hypothetical protein